MKTSICEKGVLFTVKDVMKLLLPRSYLHASVKPLAQFDKTVVKSQVPMLCLTNAGVAAAKAGKIVAPDGNHCALAARQLQDESNESLDKANQSLESLKEPKKAAGMAAYNEKKDALEAKIKDQQNIIDNCNNFLFILYDEGECPV
jgi:hypothetical protein